MGRRKHKSKMGWFGWTLISVIVITIAVSSMFFFNIFQLNLGSIFNGEEDMGDAVSEDDITSEGKEEIARVRETVGKQNRELGNFVSRTHEFYNKTTGYGGISNLDWDEQREQAQSIIDTIDEMDPDISDESLLTDLDAIVNLSQRTLEEEEAANVRNLHRYFHDLDIALNDYTSYDRIWNITETLEKIE